MNKKEKKAIEETRLLIASIGDIEYDDGAYLKEYEPENYKLVTSLITVLNLIFKLEKENKRYKRLAETNLKNSQEFQDNMCNHRCIKNNQILELQEENKNLKEQLYCAISLKDSYKKGVQTKDKMIDLILDDMNLNGNPKQDVYRSYESRAISILKSKEEEDNETGNN